MINHSGKVRVFVALDLPTSAKATLSQTVQELRSTLPREVRWVDPAGIHLTLKFLGDVETGTVEKLLKAMGEASEDFRQSSLNLRLSALGTFPNAREPRVLWAGVDGDMAELGDLQQRIEESMSTLGFLRERRPFRPHLTLGRVRDQVSPADRRRIGMEIQQATLPTNESWLTREVHLIRSTLTPQGAIYSSIGKTSLGREL